MALIEEFDTVAVEASAYPIKLVDADDALTAHSVARDAISFTRRLRPNDDFATAPCGSLELTDAGRERAERLAPVFGPLWSERRRRGATLSTALLALRRFELHSHCAVIGDVVELAKTVRPERLPDGAMVGLHDLLAAKDELGPEPGQDVVEQCPLRQCLLRYPHLAGAASQRPGLTAEPWAHSTA